MKKIIAIILSVVLIMGTAVPAFALSVDTNAKSSVPVIYIRGDSNVLAYDNETKSFQIGDMLNIYGNSEKGSFSEAAFNILYPLILKGIAFDDWDDYYDALYKEISDVYEPIKLDENGDPNTDCGIPQWQKDDMQNAMTYNRADAQGKYTERTYWFYYDWRLDPIVLADQLHEYIEGVKKASGHDKVSLSVKCLGSNIALAYINKYGTDSIKGFAIDVSTSMGADFLSGMLSGNFGLDGNAVSRFINCYTLDSDLYDLARFVTSTIDLLELSGALDKIDEVGRELIFSKIEQGVVSALALSTFMTYPGYWAVVSVDDFDNALRYVFGEEGSEKRETYKGLIERVTYYNETIKKNVYSIMEDVHNAGVNLCIISKYGIPMLPTIKTCDILADEYVSVYNSSFGATTSTVYTTLSEDYIAKRVAEGNGKYISPDKQVDASTCLFPDYTWFFKGAPHGHFSDAETSLLMQVIDADRQLTVDDFDITQFIVYDYPTRTAYPMTTENCDIPYWSADDSIDHPKTKTEKLRSFLTLLFQWLKNAFRLLKSELTKES